MPFRLSRWEFAPPEAACGVTQVEVASVRVVPGWWVAVRGCELPEATESCPVAVGQDEEALALVRGADFRRCEEALRDPVAKAFEAWTDNVPVPKSKMSSHVFEEAPGGLNLSDDSLDRRPEVPRVCCPESLAGDAEGLAGVTANDSLHAAAPRATIEGVQVPPNRRVIQGTVRNTRSQDFAGSDFVFHVADRPSASAQSAMHSEVETAGAGAEAEDTFGL